MFSWWKCLTKGFEICSTSCRCKPIYGYGRPHPTYIRLPCPSSSRCPCAAQIGVRWPRGRNAHVPRGFSRQTVPIPTTHHAAAPANGSATFRWRHVDADVSANDVRFSCSTTNDADGCHGFDILCLMDDYVFKHRSACVASNFCCHVLPLISKHRLPAGFIFFVPCTYM